MHERFTGTLRDHWKQHASSVVKEAHAKYDQLSDCLVVLSLEDGAPRLIKRSEAPERLEKRGYNPYALDLIEGEDRDSLGLVWKEGELTRTAELVVSRGKKPAKPMDIPPFTRPLTFDDQWIDGVSTMMWGLQQQIYDHVVEAIGDAVSEYMIFWSLFDGSPTLIVREAAKSSLGKHKQWKEILGHIYTPCEDVMSLIEISGYGMRRFVRPGKE